MGKIRSNQGYKINAHVCVCVCERLYINITGGYFFSTILLYYTYAWCALIICAVARYIKFYKSYTCILLLLLLMHFYASIYYFVHVYTAKVDKNVFCSRTQSHNIKYEYTNTVMRWPLKHSVSLVSYKDIKENSGKMLRTT